MTYNIIITFLIGGKNRAILPSFLGCTACKHTNGKIINHLIIKSFGGLKPETILSHILRQVVIIKCRGVERGAGFVHPYVSAHLK